MGKKLAIIPFLLSACSVYAQTEIQYKSTDPVDVGYFLMMFFWLALLLSVVFIVLFLLKKYSNFSSFKFLQEGGSIQVKGSRQYGLTVYSIRYEGSEYLFIEKGGSLIQVDLLKGKAIPELEASD